VTDGVNLSELARSRGLADRLLTNEPMSKHTSFKIGGPADYFAAAETETQLRASVGVAQELQQPLLIVGRGTNLLVADGGYRGLVIENRCCRYRMDPESHIVEAEAGLPLALLARQTAESGAGGLEWAIGIPGTLGGAIVNNAGAYDGEMAAVVRAAKVLDSDGLVHELRATDLALGYRTSRFKNAHASGEIILSAELQLNPESVVTLREHMDRYLAQRRAAQPRQPSAGSVFKNPPGGSAAQLIEEAGLKGTRVGGAQISEKHANYIVNLGDARAEQVLRLIAMVKEQVRQHFGVDLELEIELVGELAGSAAD
jgi:UDP-N-acetylmuramate dehydrogenase